MQYDDLSYYYYIYGCTVACVLPAELVNWQKNDDDEDVEKAANKRHGKQS